MHMYGIKPYYTSCWLVKFTTTVIPVDAINERSFIWLVYLDGCDRTDIKMHMVFDSETGNKQQSLFIRSSVL